jgi:hypothetical protein
MSASCGAICVLDDNPDARCAAGPFCDADGNLNACSCDFVIARGSCGGADCHTMGGIALHPGLDAGARCGDPAQETSALRQRSATVCWFGFVAGASTAVRSVPQQPARRRLRLTTSSP